MPAWPRTPWFPGRRKCRAGALSTASSHRPQPGLVGYLYAESGAGIQLKEHRPAFTVEHKVYSDIPRSVISKALEAISSISFQ
jgi:hypothetical protein